MEKRKLHGKDRTVFLFSVGILVFFLLFYTTEKLKIDFVLLGVLWELLIIPVLIGELILLFLSIKSLHLSKYSMRSWSFVTIIILFMNMLLFLS